MKKLYIIVVLALLCLTAGHAALNEAKADSIIKLIKNKGEQRYCGKGFGTITKTIRSNSGDYCRDALNAAIAMRVCGHISDFKASQCHGIALTAIKNAEPTASDTSSGALSILKKSDLGKTCTTIGEILPDLVSECLDL